MWIYGAEIYGDEFLCDRTESPLSVRMELPEEAVRLLQDEAYVALCREALDRHLVELTRKRAVVTSTRPPFGVLARKETRIVFARTMQAVHDQETALKNAKAELDSVFVQLHPRVERAVADYLAQVSSDYSHLEQVLARLDDWQRALQGLPELLLGFARDLRTLRLAVGEPKLAPRKWLSELAALREMASRLARQHRELQVVSMAVAEAAIGLWAKPLELPALPDFDRLGWIGRLTTMKPEQIVQETARVEAEVRRFLADGAEAALARWEACRASCEETGKKLIEAYWQQLRMHAQAHYVEECDILEKVRSLHLRYVEAEVIQRQHELSFDPLIN